MFRRYHAHIDCELAPGREIVIVHDPLPPDVAFLSVGVRRYGPDEAPPRQLLRPHDLATGNRRDLRVLSSGMCGDPPPPLAIGNTYCVSLAAHDAAGNASGGEVEVCGPVIDCRNPAWYPMLQCPLPYAAPRSPAVASLLAVLVMLAWWRRSRHHRRADAPRWAP